MRALVTGSHGFIGRHFVEHLHEQGYSVLQVDVASPHPIDCRDFFRKSRFHFDLVIHAAAQIPAVDNRLANPMIVLGNIELDAAMFAWALKTRPSHVVYFSSTAVYARELSGRPLHEDDVDLDAIRQPDAYYGFVKLVGEVQAREAQRAGLDVVVVRPQSGYGADQSLRYPFPSIIRRVRERTRPVIVWGSGNQVRDFIHVDDVVAGTMQLLKSDERRPVNLGTGTPTSMRGLAEAALGIMGERPNVVADHTKPEGAPGRWADTDRMRRVFVPSITLREGIKRALEGL